MVPKVSLILLFSFSIVLGSSATSKPVEGILGLTGIPVGYEVNEVLSYFRKTNKDEYTLFLMQYEKIVGDYEITKIIVETALDLDVPVHLSLALAQQESGFNPNAVNRNPKGSEDRGLYQLNNAARKWRKSWYFDPYRNTREGLSYLKFCMNKNKNINLGLAMYNTKPALVAKGAVPYSTMLSVLNIRGYEKAFDELFFEKALMPSPFVKLISTNQVARSY